MPIVRPRCGARLKQGHGHCRRWPVHGRTRCRLHGGLSTGPRVYRARDMSAAIAGRRRWLERMKRAKAEGRIAKIPTGRIPGRRKGEPIEVSRARAAMKREMANLPAQVDRPFAELKPPEMLDALTPKALCKMAEILDLPTDLEALGGDRVMQHRVYRLQADVAQSITAARIKVDDASLRHQQHEDWMEGFNKKLAEAEAKLQAQKR
jgi:hypothetical protein